MNAIERAIALSKAQRILDREEERRRIEREKSCKRKKEDTLPQRTFVSNHWNTFGGSW